ncbi:Ig-like domain-containing protein [Candidatus Bathyarchaeota archaeon]|nr:Ig-like domain-containing protein [Candidatus Bathyarchaeota archaeon]
MPGILVQTVWGLIALDSFEVATGWSYSETDELCSGLLPNTQVYMPAYHGQASCRIYATNRPCSAQYSKNFNLGSSTVKRLGFFKKRGYQNPSYPMPGSAALIIDAATVWSVSPVSGESDAWNFSSWININAYNDSKSLILKVTQPTVYNSGTDYLWDKLVMLAGITVKVTGLVAGQKIKVYRANDVLVGEATVAGGATSAEVDVMAVNDQPFQGYIQIYATNGTTLLYTLPAQELCGGDSFQYSASASYIVGPPDSLRIYKQGAVANPKSMGITVTLRDENGTPQSGRIITFSTPLGSVSPGSAATNGAGQASTTLTSGIVAGWAFVEAAWAGALDLGASRTIVEIAIYHDAPTGDSSSPYQVFIQGREYLHAAGNYTRLTAFQPGTFSVELTQVQDEIASPLEILIYRRGILDFRGRILKIVRKIEDRMVVSGLTNHWKLSRRVAKRSYNDEPKSIIEDLLLKYPSGIVAGNISTFGQAILMNFNYDPLTLCLQRILDLTGWTAFINLDDRIDVGPTLGTATSVEFKTGLQNVALTREIDFVLIDTRTILVGNPSTLISDKADLAKQAEYGLIEQVFYSRNLTTQAMLDIQNQMILDTRKNPVNRISGTVIDLAYSPDAYDVFDTVIVTDMKTGLSGAYGVMSLRRNLDDHGSTELELSASQLAFEDSLTKIAIQVKDLST